MPQCGNETYRYVLSANLFCQIEKNSVSVSLKSIMPRKSAFLSLRMYRLKQIGRQLIESSMNNILNAVIVVLLSHEPQKENLHQFITDKKRQ